MSRLFKAINDIPEKDQKVIKIKTFERTEEISDTEFKPSYNEAEIQQLLHNAKAEAEQILQNARESAEQLEIQMQEQRELLQQEKQAIFDQAQEEGFAAGLEDGRKQGYNDYAEHLMLAKQTVDLSKKDYGTYVDQAERTILQIGIKVAGKIVNEDLSVNAEHYFSYVKRALKEAREQNDVQLHVHPLQYEFLLEHKDELIAVFPKETRLYVFPNEELSETSCVIESESGRIDASIDSQLKEIKDKLFEKMESEQ